MDFKPFVESSAARPRHNSRDAVKVTTNTVFRDNFSITTWLALGASLQVLAVLFLPQLYAMTPVILVLSYRSLKALLVHYGVLQNSMMDGVLMGKFSAMIPGRNGERPRQASGQSVAVLILAARSNHALGVFGPGYQDVSQFMYDMIDDLWDNADEYGFLSQTAWLAANERVTNNQVMILCYFRSIKDLHEYAHSPLHRRAWDFWNQLTKTHPHLSIMHEVYEAPKNHWENIFINNHQTGIANMPPTVNFNGQSVYPLVSASRGGLRSQKGRMGYGDGAENELYGPEPY